jgi:MipA family protein
VPLEWGRTNYAGMRMKKFLVAMLALPACIAMPCRAESGLSLPLWEVGAGVATLSIPDYRGSDRRRGYVLPLPYFMYRGEFLKADRNGVRAALFTSDRVEANLSLNATVPVDSADNPLRQGMADLRPTVELGPTLDFHLWNSASRNMKLDFRAPLRAAITIESSPKHIGSLFAPSLNLDVIDPAGFAGWKLGIGGGPLISSRNYNRYFYSVSPTEARPGRPAYAASGGYSGMQFTTTLSKRFARYWVGGFLRYDNLAGAVFADSPLVQRRNALSAGVGVAWIFGASHVRVNAPE